MLIALPTRDGVFTEHFGRCDGFHLCQIGANGAIEQPRLLARPTRGKCESLPKWLRSVGVTTLLVGGMGEVARRQFAELQIDVHFGIAGAAPLAIVAAFIHNPPEPGANRCATLPHRHHHCRNPAV